MCYTCSLCCFLIKQMPGGEKKKKNKPTLSAVGNSWRKNKNKTKQMNKKKTQENC